MSFSEQIASFGIVGCGGAGFPTHVKLKGTFEYLIINGAECEPLLQNDKYLMREKADELVETTALMAREMGIPHAIIALKHHYTAEIAALQKAIQATDAAVTLHEMSSFYPAGDEQTLVYEVTGRVVPPAGLPGQVGAVVDNVATVHAIHEALRGIPLTHKYVTVTGEVADPVIVYVPIGTPISRLFELAGGLRVKDVTVVIGGPMMGRVLNPGDLENEVVTKTTSGVLALPAGGAHARQNAVPVTAMLSRARSACIQCTQCTQLCPRHLLGHPLQPHRIMRHMATGRPLSDMLDDAVIRSAQLCCECGVCEIYACPMGLQPRRVNALIKRELGKAGIRYQRQEDAWTASPLRETRKAPTERIAARAGVYKYQGITIDRCVADTPCRVRIPLKMHIGAPSLACVEVGQSVQKGDVIATVPDGALGATVHASISGRVESVDTAIAIVKE